MKYEVCRTFFGRAMGMNIAAHKRKLALTTLADVAADARSLSRLLLILYIYIYMYVCI